VISHFLHKKSPYTEKFFDRISNSRSIHGEDLLNLFKLQVPDALLMNIASNLGTIKVHLCNDNFSEQNKRIEAKHEK
jgi:hypothetical protein